MSSPSPSSSDTTAVSASSDTEMEPVNNFIYCMICKEPFSAPKILSCLHTFCESCLEVLVDTSSQKVRCYICNFETAIGEGGLKSLQTNHSVSTTLLKTEFAPNSFHCRQCKQSPAGMAISFCLNCKCFLCSSCTDHHQYIHYFTSHVVLMLSDLPKREKQRLDEQKETFCPIHVSKELKYYCRTCRAPICHDCTIVEHHGMGHICVYLSDVNDSEIGQMGQMRDHCYRKAGEQNANAKKMASQASALKDDHQDVLTEIEETRRRLVRTVNDLCDGAKKKADQIYNSSQVTISDTTLRMIEDAKKLASACDVIEKMLKNATSAENLLMKGHIEAHLQKLCNSQTELPSLDKFRIQYVPNTDAVIESMQNLFGQVLQGKDLSSNGTLSLSSARTNSYTASTFSYSSILANNSTFNSTNFTNSNSFSTPSFVNGNTFDTASLTKTNSYNSSPTFINGNQFTYRQPSSQAKESSIDLTEPCLSYNLDNSKQYERWSNGVDAQASTQDVFSTSVDPYSQDSASRALANLSLGPHPPRSQVRRQKMVYNVKVGEFGMQEGQFTEPSGVATAANDDIVVADTNNHRIQIFDKTGNYRFQFGEGGKRDGQLLYPNRVAVMRSTGDIIVTERSPTHQVQIYSQYGQFLKKFGANTLQHPRGVAVDSKGRIIIVECKVMRICIFDMEGNMLNKFGCSKHLQFPNSVVVNDKEEIFISDNRAHCVKVFSYTGDFLRQIGGEGITNYPIGVGINHLGQVVVADNHNNFNITTFTQDGQLISAFESKVKHAQCFDVALMNDGGVVLASKDYKLYVYSYM